MDHKKDIDRMRNILLLDSISVERCRGASGGECRFALPMEEPSTEAALLKGLEERTLASGWQTFVSSRFPDRIPSHALFRIAISGCANGCSRPQIADLGLLRAARPIIARPQDCTACGLCVEACPEGLVFLAETESGELAPAIRTDECLACGRCVRACEFGALEMAEPGWRLQVGGKLGRKPRLGIELEGILSTDQALGVFHRMLSLLMEHGQPGERFGALMDRLGHDRCLSPLTGNGHDMGDGS